MFNNILNKTKMGNEELKEDIYNLQNLMLNIADINDKLKKKLLKSLPKKCKKRTWKLVS